MNQRLNTAKKNRKNQFRILIAVGLFINTYLLLSFFFGEMGLVNAAKVQTEHAKVASEIVSLQDENENLLNQIDALEHNTDAIERLARERLGLVKEGELVYEFFEIETP